MSQYFKTQEQYYEEANYVVRGTRHLQNNPGSGSDEIIFKNPEHAANRQNNVTARKKNIALKKYDALSNLSSYVRFSSYSTTYKLGQYTCDKIIDWKQAEDFVKKAFPFKLLTKTTPKSHYDFRIKTPHGNIPVEVKLMSGHMNYPPQIIKSSKTQIRQILHPSLARPTVYVIVSQDYKKQTDSKRILTLWAITVYTRKNAKSISNTIDRYKSPIMNLDDFKLDMTKIVKPKNKNNVLPPGSINVQTDRRTTPRVPTSLRQERLRQRQRQQQLDINEYNLRPLNLNQLFNNNNNNF